MITPFNDCYLAFTDAAQANSVMPMGSYPNMLDAGKDPRDLLGRYWRYVRIKQDEVMNPAHIAYQVAAPLEPVVVWMDGFETGELLL